MSHFHFACFTAWLAAALSAVTTAAETPSFPCPPLLQKPASLAQAETQASRLMQEMTPEERFDFVCGNGFGIRAVSRLGIPELRFGDASCGLRVNADPSGKNVTTAFPCTLLLAATWDTNAFRQYGQCVAEEFRANGRHFILGPGMNLYRNSRDGRNFEFLGEDPFLAGQVVAAYVRGAQEVNVGTTLKHFIGNETENHRRGENSVVDERTLHEIYMAPFKAGIDAGAWAVMTSYNLVNGEWAGQSRPVSTELLRRQLGFQYLIMTDWNSTWQGDRLASSGTDLEEPDGHALKLDRDKIFGGPEIDRMVVEILKTSIMSGLYQLEAEHKFKQPDWREKYPAHAEFSKRVNGEGIVLLANNGLLPLPKKFPGRILVTGNTATLKELSGGGSGHLIGYNLTTCLQAAQNTFGTNNLVYAESPSDDDIHSAQLVLLFTGRRPEGHGYEGEASNHAFDLPDAALIERCTRLNRQTVVNLTCGGGSQMDWAGQAAAITFACYGGQTGPGALLDILTGEINPSGKLPFSIEKNFNDSCTAGDDALTKSGKTIMDPQELASRAGIGRWSDFVAERGSDRFRTYDLEYTEGIFTGYRWYDEKNIEPRYPFGFGLSYTKFAYSDLKITANESAMAPAQVVQFAVKNTGGIAGDEVAQIYVEFPKNGVPQPRKELKGFARVHLLPGQSKEAGIPLETDAFSFWHPEEKRWVRNAGTYKIDVAASSKDIRLSQNILLPSLVDHTASH